MTDPRDEKGRELAQRYAYEREGSDYSPRIPKAWEALTAHLDAGERERRELRAMVKELADDVAAWVEHEYATTKDHPAMKRRYDRDMDLVKDARALLDRYPEAT